MPASFRAAWQEFWRAVRASVDPDIRLQQELDKLHEEYRRQRAERFERYYAVWRSKRESEEARKREESVDRRQRYSGLRRIG